ncbi:MAG: OsmC family protein [Bacteroidales bacterium]|jgi:putative redox protein
MEKVVDKTKEVCASVVLINDKLNFKGIAGVNNPVSIDYIPPLGDNLGYTSLELLLLSLSSCIGSSVLLFLRKMKKTIAGFEIKSRGLRKEEHPTGFKIIFVEINLKSSDVTVDNMNKVIKLSEDTYCPVWSMIKGNAEIDVKYKITS